MNSNLFSRLIQQTPDPSRTAIETASGAQITYSDLIARSG